MIFPGGRIAEVPDDWELLPPGDAALTRRVKAAGPSWTVQQQKGRRTFTTGVYADAASIAQIRADLVAERSTAAYARRQTADLRRRKQKQAAYVDSFRDAVLHFLRFDARYYDIADRLATAVTEHATPVGSGTVARTQRIPLEQRAESAVIAWLRHHTTAYDKMRIPRERGRRRDVRRLLAGHSRELLKTYRAGKDVTAGCPLQKALRPDSDEGPTSDLT